MRHKKILILGGYGNAGLEIASLLAYTEDIQIFLAGRSAHRAIAAAECFGTAYGKGRISGMEANAASR